MPSDRHVIRRHLFEITVSDAVLGTHVQTFVRDCFERNIVPVLDREFSALAGPDEIVRLERLELDLGTIAPDELERELPDRLRNVLRRELQKQSTPSILSSEVKTVTEGPRGGSGRDRFEQERIGKNKNVLLLFESFLETGVLPWWSSHVTLESMGQELMALTTGDHAALVKLLRKALKRRAPLYRLIQQLSDKVLLFLGGILSGLQQQLIFDVLTEASKIMEALPSGRNRNEARTHSWHALLLSLPDAKSDLSQAALIRRMAQTLSPFIGKELLNYDQEYGDGCQQSQTALSEEIIKICKQESRVDKINSQRRASPSKGNGSRDDTPADFLFTEGQSQSDNTIPSQSRADPTPDSTARQNAKQSEGRGLDLPNSLRAEQSRAGLPLPDISGDARQIVQTVQKEGIGIRNCGLVILWPYLGRFFSACGILANGAFPDDRAIVRGVHLLNLLSAGTDSAEEHLLAINKILCGRALEEPVDRETILSRSERAEAENLLKTAIGHWTALKQTSVHAFRSSFLQRPGILSRKESGWLLQVERKPYDVLLERLPWSISIIKLSWMKQPLHVEW